MNEKPPTRQYWDAASPFTKGYVSYTYASWPGSQIPKKCPFKEGTDEYDDYQRGQQQAVFDAQDSEE